MIKKLFVYLMRGVLYIVPLSLTIYAIYLAFSFIDNILSPIIGDILGYEIPGLGFLLIILLFIILGSLGSTFLFRWIYSVLDSILGKVPLIKLIYSSIKDFTNAFFGKKKKFTEPVLIKINKELDIEKIGFVTNTSLEFLGDGEKKIAVYMPFGFSFMGDLYIVPAENIRPLDMSSAEAMKFVVSGGVTNVDVN